MVKMQITELFFDKPAVMRAVDAAKREVLSKAGATLRLIAKHSIRKRKGTSAPGQPPHSHDGSLRRFIFYSYERETDSVFVGPMKIKVGFPDGDGKPVDGTVPSVLEGGGAITVKEVFYRSRAVPGRGRWYLARRFSPIRPGGTKGLPTRRRVARVEARPYMMPALLEVRPKLPKMWQGSIRVGVS